MASTSTSTSTSTSASAVSTRDDRELARLALAGDGEAFAQLYDRHERRVFGFCLRMLGSEDEAAEATQETFMRLLRRLPALAGRELNFAAYALASARNACYDAIQARRRVEPVAEPPEPSGCEPAALELDPERAALLRATREAVRAANARLPDRQREVLALRELEQLSYEQIGELVGLNSNAVAQLISRARIRLRELVRGGELESIAVSSTECERALALLSRIQDEQTCDAGELGWVRAHVDGCETCALSRAAMQEAGVSYRALGPIVVLAWLRQETIARAAELVGADWGHVARAGAGHGRDPGSGGDPAPSRSSSHRRLTGIAAMRRLRARMLAAVLLCAALALLLAGTLTRDARVRLRPATSAASASSLARASAKLRAFERARDARFPSHGSRVANGVGAGPAVATSAGATQSVPLGAPVEPAGPHRHAGRRHSTPRAGVRQPPAAPAPTTQPTTQPPAATTPTSSVPSQPPSEAGSPATATTPTQTSTGSTTTSPSAPGGPPEGGHECPLAALAC
jgi:RNA polymerase sigma-70 factor (ECF subfamily)